MLDNVSHGQRRRASQLEFLNIPQLGGQPHRSGWEPKLSGVRQQLPPLIIHVDDEHGMLTLMRLILERLGSCRVLSYDHSAPALDACYDTRPALLITDIMRPNDIDGVTLCQQIRQDPLLHDLPLLILSAKSDYRLNPLPDVAFVSKPCSARELVRVIDELVATGPLS